MTIIEAKQLLSIPEVTPKVARRVSMFAQRLQRLPAGLGKHPGLLFSPGLEGYRDYTFGARSGPSVQVRHIFHELGHAAQFGPNEFKNRAHAEGYVFKMHKMTCMGKQYPDLHTSQATNRELETFAYELHLMQASGFKCDVNEYIRYSASVMRHMDDWSCIPGDTGKARHRECMRRLREYFESITQVDAVSRLTGWLDLTHQRLRRKHNRPYREVALRFHTDGTLQAA